MSLGHTIVRTPRGAGTWSVQGVTSELNLSERAVVELGGQIGPTGQVGAPGQELVLTLRPRAGVDVAQLRRDLLPFCRPETNTFTLLYVGAVRALELACAYRGGLESLALRLVAPELRWLGGGTQSFALPASTVILGSAATAPTLRLSGAGAVARIRSTFNHGYLVRDLLLNLTLAPGEIVAIDTAALTITSSTRGALLGALQAGSQLASFRLLPDGLNQLELTGDAGVNCQCQYSPAWWSWEDADA